MSSRTFQSSKKTNTVDAHVLICTNRAQRSDRTGCCDLVASGLGFFQAKQSMTAPAGFRVPSPALFLFPDTCSRAGHDSRCFDCDVGGLEPLFKRLLSDGHTSFRCVVSLQLPIFEIPSRVCISGFAYHSVVWYYLGLCQEILENPNFNGRIRPSALHFVTQQTLRFFKCSMSTSTEQLIHESGRTSNGTIWTCTLSHEGSDSEKHSCPTRLAFAPLPIFQLQNGM